MFYKITNIKLEITFRKNDNLMEYFFNAQQMQERGRALKKLLSRGLSKLLHPEGQGFDLC